ncbi:hypothetical protein D3C86_1844340 [compost metagenome]
MIAHRIVTATQIQLIGQPQRAVPIKRRAPLLLAGAAQAVVAAGQPGAPGFLRGVFDQYFAAANVLARRQLHLCLIRWQAVELIDQLLDFAQVDQFTGFSGECHAQLSVGQLAARSAFQPFELALDHQHLQVPAGQVLLR